MSRFKHHQSFPSAIPLNSTVTNPNGLFYSEMCSLVSEKTQPPLCVLCIKVIYGSCEKKGRRKGFIIILVCTNCSILTMALLVYYNLQSRRMPQIFFSLFKIIMCNLWHSSIILMIQFISERTHRMEIIVLELFQLRKVSSRMFFSMQH